VEGQVRSTGDRERKSKALGRIHRLEELERARLEREERAERARLGVLDAARGTLTGRARTLDRYEHVARIPMAVLGLAWAVVGIAVITLHMHGSSSEVLVGLLFGFWAVVLVEYVVRLFVSPDRRSYASVRRVEPIVVLVPALQPMRLFGLEKVSLIATEVTLQARALLRHRSLFRVFLVAAGLIFLGAWLVLLAEDHAPGSNIHSYGDAIWWAIVTATTVGYGDRFPVSAVGRVVAVVIMLVGIGLIGTITATVASFFVQQHADESTEKLKQAHEDVGVRIDSVDQRLARMEALMGAQQGAEQGAEQGAATGEGPGSAGGRAVDPAPPADGSANPGT
jgi:voltage-gated potassium channel